MIRFIHIPKTGGSSVRKFLLDNDIPHKFGKFIEQDDGTTIYFKKHKPAYWWINKFPNETNFFTVVRNPYYRLISYYRYLIKEKYLDFIEWEKFVTNKINVEGHYVWNLQIEWIYDISLQNQIVDHILKFENLENNVCSFFNVNKSFPKINITNNNLDYQSMYLSDPKIVDIIYNHFKDDFIKLNYNSTL